MERVHHRLRVWQEAMRLVKDVYEVTAQFPKRETYGLASQMRRAAVSVPSNIAEGAARSGQKEFLQFLSHARGSLSELETQYHIARQLGYLCESSVLERIDDVFGLLSGLVNSIRRKS